ncbi:MAG TPA: DUF535 family protein [Bacteroidales bacterium]
MKNKEKIRSEGKRTGSDTTNYFRLLRENFGNMIVRIPILNVAVDGWRLATQAFADERKSYQRRQKWRSFFGALMNAKFASAWFRILKSPDFLVVSEHRPRLYFKIFNVYMSIRWTRKQKIKVILDSYRYIMSKGEAFMQVITNSNGLEIARFKLNDTIEGALILRYDNRYRKEGEMVFSFECDRLGGKIVDAAFSVEEVSDGCWVCRIGCIQGHARNDEYYSKEAQKLMHGLRPKSFIIFAIQEFSRQLGVTALYGVGDSIQAYRRKHTIHLPWRHSIHFNYNSIWTESGGQPGSDGWYELPLTPVRKEMHEIKTTKRALYLRRYKLLDALSLQIAVAVTGLSDESASAVDTFKNNRNFAQVLYKELQVS